MNSIKPVAVIGLLTALGLAVYFKMSDGPEPEPPEEFSGATWGTPPSVEIPGSYAGSASPHPLGESDAAGAPRFGPISSGPGSPPVGSTDTRSAAELPSWGDPTASAPNASSAPAALPFEIHSGPSSAEVPAGNQNRPPGVSGLQSGRATSSTTPPSPRYAAADGYRANPGTAAVAGSTDHQHAAAPENSSYPVARRAAQAALDRGGLAQAFRLLSHWYDDPSLSPSDRRELVELLGQLAGTVLYSTNSFLEPPYEAEAGDTVQSVAHKYRVPWQLLAKINGIGEDGALVPGQKLKVVRGPFSAVVDLEERILTLMAGDYYAGRFRIGIGSERPHMEGAWIVKHKVTNPTYYGRDRVMDADDVNNPLGERWIGLASEDQPSVVKPFGIHGTHNGRSIDRDDPRGYIRLTPQDAEDVYDILSIGSRVIVRK
ncbi:MAG: L,D-transpeptidase family protein [Pirellulales bacterium]